jgi:CheY-like chemotaxis protein
MTPPLRILLLEDSIQDAELIQELLEADHFVCDVTRVQTRGEFLAALEDGGFDLVLADYALPSFDGLSALKLTLSARPDLPFIFVSGFGEEIAIDALTSGAADYVLKTRLSRLVPSVQRALREARERAERRKTEEALLRILLLEDSIQDAALIQDLLEADQFVCDVTRVQARDEFLAALEDGGFDLILADYKLPSFDGLSALKLALSARPDLPFIFVSGFGEEIAIEALTSGATDYILKTRLSRLVPSVQRALREARERAGAIEPHGEFRLERFERGTLLVRWGLSSVWVRAWDKAHHSVGDRPHSSGRPGASPSNHRSRREGGE